MMFFLASFGRKFTTGRLKFLSGVVQMIGSTRSKFDVWLNRRCKLNLGRPKLKFRLIHGTKKCRKYKNTEE